MKHVPFDNLSYRDKRGRRSTFEPTKSQIVKIEKRWLDPVMHTRHSVAAFASEITGKEVTVAQLRYRFGKRRSKEAWERAMAR